MGPDDPAYAACDWNAGLLDLRAHRVTVNYSNAWDIGGTWYPSIDPGLTAGSFIENYGLNPLASGSRVTEYSTEDYLALSSQTIEANVFESPDSSGLNVPETYSKSAKSAAASLKKSSDSYAELLAQYRACQAVGGQCAVSVQELALAAMGQHQPVSEGIAQALLYSIAIKGNYSAQMGSKFAAISESSIAYNSEAGRLETAVNTLYRMGVECPAYSNKLVKSSYYDSKDLLAALSDSPSYSGKYAYAADTANNDYSTASLFAGGYQVLNYSDLGASRNFNLIFSGTQAEQPLLLTLGQKTSQAENAIGQVAADLKNAGENAGDAKTAAEGAKNTYLSSGADLVIAYYAPDYSPDSWAADELFNNATAAFDFATYRSDDSANYAVYKIYDFGMAESEFSQSAQDYAQLQDIAAREVDSRRESAQQFKTAVEKKLKTVSAGIGPLARESANDYLSSAADSLSKSQGKDLYGDMIYIDSAMDDIAWASGIIDYANSPDTGELDTEAAFGKLDGLIAAAGNDGLAVSGERQAYGDMVWDAKQAILHGIDISPYRQQSDSMYAGLLARLADYYSPLQQQYAYLRSKGPALAKTESYLKGIGAYFDSDSKLLPEKAAGHWNQISSALSTAMECAKTEEPAALSSRLASGARIDYALSEAQIGADTPFSIIVLLSNPTTLSLDGSTHPEGIVVPLKLDMEVSTGANVTEGSDIASVQSVSGKTLNLLVSGFPANGAREITVRASSRFASMSLPSAAETVSNLGAKYSSRFSITPARDLELAKLSLPVPAYYSNCTLQFQGRPIGGFTSNDGTGNMFNVEFGPLSGSAPYKDIEADCLNPSPYRVSQSAANITIFNSQLNMWSEYTVSDSAGDFASPLVEIVLPQSIDKSAFRVESSDPETQISGSQISAGAGFSVAKIKLQSISPGKTYSFRIYGISDQAGEYVGSYIDFASARISGLGLAGKYSQQMESATALYSSGDYAGAFNAAFAALKSAESAYNATAAQQADYASAHEQAVSLLAKTKSRYYNLSQAFDSADAPSLSMISKAETHLADSEKSAALGNYSQAFKSANLALSDLAANALIDFQNKIIAKGISANADKLSAAQKSLGASSDSYVRIEGLRSQISSMLKSLPLSNSSDFDSGLSRIAALESQAVKLVSDSQAVGLDSQKQALDEADAALALADQPLQYLESSYASLSKSKSFKPAFDPKKKRSELQGIAGDVTKLRSKTTPESGFSAASLSLAEASAQQARQASDSILAENARLNSTALSLSSQASNWSQKAGALAKAAGEPYAAASAKPLELAIAAGREYESGNFSASLAASEESISKSQQLISAIPPAGGSSNGLLIPIAAAAACLAIVAAYIYLSGRKGGEDGDSHENGHVGFRDRAGETGGARKLARKREN
ncbi:MAG: hypothetical protein WC506_02495 [Candidatus Micrarchaeia archaeon]